MIDDLPKMAAGNQLPKMKAEDEDIIKELVSISFEFRHDLVGYYNYRSFVVFTAVIVLLVILYSLVHQFFTACLFN